MNSMRDKISDYPINTVISTSEFGSNYIRVEGGWAETESIESDWYPDTHFDNGTEVTVLAVPLDLPALIKNIATTTIDAFLEVRKERGMTIDQESIEIYREELAKTDFTDDAVKWYVEGN